MAKAKNKATGRDYTYDTAYEARPEQVKARASRNAARRQMEAKHGAAAVKGKDVSHKDNNPRNNDPKNLRLESKSKNRGRKA